MFVRLLKSTPSLSLSLSLILSPSLLYTLHPPRDSQHTSSTMKRTQSSNLTPSSASVSLHGETKGKKKTKLDESVSTTITATHLTSLPSSPTSPSPTATSSTETQAVLSSPFPNHALPHPDLKRLSRTSGGKQKVVKGSERFYGFAPHVGSMPLVLILGSAPSVLSAKYSQYYGMIVCLFFSFEFSAGGCEEARVCMWVSFNLLPNLTPHSHSLAFALLLPFIPTLHPPN